MHSYVHRRELFDRFETAARFNALADKLADPSLAHAMFTPPEPVM